MLDISTVNWVAAGVFGLLIGSFLNVVIYRLPKIMEMQWRQECTDCLREDQEPSSTTENLEETARPPVFNLATPRSSCPSCGHSITWYENIPVLSFLFLGGKCSSCKSKVSLRYPCVELLTSVFFMYCCHRWGFNLQGAAWCLFSAALITLAFIDWDTTLLPDDITMPLLWIGITASLTGVVDVPIKASVTGAILGYMSLWSIYWIFKIITKKEGMGYGDFKLYAALGAWLGAEALLPIILISSVLGAIVGIAMKIKMTLREGGYIPFGPFLVLSGMLCMIFGYETILGSIQKIMS